MSSRRRRGREAALQLLFASDIENELTEGQNREQFWQLCTAKTAARDFAEELVNGVLQNFDVIDQLLSRCVENFELPRLSAVDRNLLRIATYELHFSEEVPAAVAINEAIEIAKTFSTTESSRFINGVLDQVKDLSIDPAQPSS